MATDTSATVLEIISDTGGISYYTQNDLRKLARGMVKGKGKVDSHYLRFRDDGRASLVVNCKGRDGWIEQLNCVL